MAEIFMCLLKVLPVSLPIVLPVVMLAGCGSAEPGTPVGPAPADGSPPLATQRQAPTPDYGPLILSPDQLREIGRASGEIDRPATAPLPRDAKAVGDLWLARLEQRGALMGAGLDGKGEDGPVSSIDTLLTAREFDQWVAQNGWQVPGHIRWRFQSELVAPQVAEGLEGAIRQWPATSRRTGWQLEAAFTGHIVLRDGCFYSVSAGRPDKLAWFHNETGLGRDDAGYFTLVSRITGETMARLGEEMFWAGPNAVDPDQPEVHALKEACGDLEIDGVGNPQALARMQTIYPHLRDATPPPPPPPSAE
jgi:hypothetical protein